MGCSPVVLSDYETMLVGQLLALKGQRRRDMWALTLYRIREHFARLRW